MGFRTMKGSQNYGANFTELPVDNVLELWGTHRNNFYLGLNTRG